MIILLIISGCNSKKHNPSCGDVSVRLMFSMGENKYGDIKKKIIASDTNAEKLRKMISTLEDFNSQLVIVAGGFEGGKSLKMVNPCKEISIQNKNFASQKTYAELVDLFASNGLIDNSKASNMKFVISSYYCKTCTFSDMGHASTAVGLLLLEQLTLQLSLTEMLYLQVTPDEH